MSKGGEGREGVSRGGEGRGGVNRKGVQGKEGWKGEVGMEEGGKGWCISTDQVCYLSR